MLTCLFFFCNVGTYGSAQVLACCEINWACTSDSGHCPVSLLVRYNELAIFCKSICFTNVTPLMSGVMEMFVCVWTYVSRFQERDAGKHRASLCRFHLFTGYSF